MVGFRSLGEKVAAAKSRWAGWLLLASSVMAAGCSGHEQGLSEWMEEVRQSTPVVHEEIPSLKAVVPFRYQTGASVEPFSVARLNFKVRVSNGLAPDLDRVRGPLESFPLDSFTLVGHLKQGKVVVALMQVDSKVHSIRLGDRIGLNFGRVTKISEAEVAVEELVQDAAGEWVERQSALRLQETRP